MKFLMLEEFLHYMKLLKYCIFFVIIFKKALKVLSAYKMCPNIEDFKREKCVHSDV